VIVELSGGRELLVRQSIRSQKTSIRINTTVSATNPVVHKRNCLRNMAFFIYKISANAEYDAGVRYSLLVTVCVVQYVLFVQFVAGDFIMCVTFC
jgi:hypothetical protein